MKKKVQSQKKNKGQCSAVTTMSSMKEKKCILQDCWHQDLTGEPASRGRWDAGRPDSSAASFLKMPGDISPLDPFFMIVGTY
jgi:hypothetical protein